jgi:hypothetical protein
MRSMSNPITEIRRHYSDREWWRGRLLDRVVIPFQQTVYPGAGGIRVMDEDWDNLIILDACRRDLFEHTVDLDRFDAYRTVTSLGSATAEWTQKNFSDGQFGDTVYLSSNPFLTKFASDSFHELVEVWREAFDEEQHTVTPDAVTERLRAAVTDHPDKRIVAHYMQPHYPFRNLSYGGWHPDGILNDGAHEKQQTPWEAMRAGLVDRATVMDAYRDNLEYVLESVSDVLDDLPGKTVVTSDHGNMAGEWGFPFPVRIYGHPMRLRYPELVEVPWAVVENGPRKEVVDDGVTELSSEEGELIERRLEELGYR